MSQEKLVWRNEKRKVKDLIEYERNPRKITEEQMEYLKNSLEKYNLVEVPTIDTDGKLVAGHQRTRALILLGRGDEEIDVRVPNRKLTEEEFKHLNIESNRLRGIFDFEMLAADFDVEDLLAMGFTERELDVVDFSELEDADFMEEADEEEQKKYELVFASIDDYKEFSAILKKIQNDLYPQSTISDALFKYLKSKV